MSCAKLRGRSMRCTRASVLLPLNNHKPKHELTEGTANRQGRQWVQEAWEMAVRGRR